MKKSEIDSLEFKEKFEAFQHEDPFTLYSEKRANPSFANLAKALKEEISTENIEDSPSNECYTRPPPQQRPHIATFLEKATKRNAIQEKTQGTILSFPPKTDKVKRNQSNYKHKESGLVRESPGDTTATENPRHSKQIKESH